MEPKSAATESLSFRDLINKMCGEVYLEGSR